MNKRTRPLLNLKQLFYISLCGFGVQFASSLQMTNSSSLFNFLGAKSADLGYLWLAAPVAGLIIQPLVGQFSDSTITKYGKRIPYIFIWLLLSCLALFLLPLANELWQGAVLVLLLSCSINGGTEALRALIGDITPNQQKATAFAWQTIFCGVGAGVAALLPWILSHIHILPKMNMMTSKVPLVLKISLFLGGLVLLLSMLLMVRNIRERSFLKSQLLYDLQSKRRRNHLKKVYGTFKELFKNIRHMPKVIKDFIVVQIFTWIGMFCLWLYFGIGLSQHIYGLPVNVAASSTNQYQLLLEKGMIEAGVCFGIYQFISVLYAFLLPKLASQMGSRVVHAVSLLVGALSIISILFMKHIELIYVAMVGVGIMWGSIMTMPYAIISAELPRSKMGVYLGIFNITITIPQIVGGLCMGFLTEKLFYNHAIYSVVFGGVLIFISGLILLFQSKRLKLAAYCQEKSRGVMSEDVNKVRINSKEELNPISI